MNLAPIATSGSVQTTAVTRRGTDGTSEFTVQQNAHLGVQSYIWYPWFAQIQGGVDVAFDKTFGETSGSALRASADTTLSVLPLSKYPATLRLSHIDSRASGDFSTADFIRDRVGLTARAAFTQNLSGAMTASWDRSDTDGSGLLNSQAIAIDLNQTFSDEDAFLGITGVGFGVGVRNNDFDADDPDDDDENRQTATLHLNLHSEPFENATYNSRYTATYDDLDEDSETSTRISLQGISTLQWRPEDKPFVVTGSTRTLTEQITGDGDDGARDSKTLLATGTLGLRWPVNDQFSFNLGLRGSYEDVSRDEGSSLGETALDNGAQLSATVIAGANYISEAQDVSGFDWRWDARAATENGIGTHEGILARESIGLGHRFERVLEDMIFVPVRFSFAQDANLSLDPNADESIIVGISNAITFNYSGSKDSVSTTGRLFLRDSRDVVGERREFQTIQARLGRRISIDRDRRLLGDLTVQAAREVTDDGSEVFATASGNISYGHRNLFDVENLGFHSELRLNATNLDELFGTSSDELGSELFRNDWRNVLTYRIGRLTANLEATAFHRDDGMGYLGLFRLRRDFGGRE